ncbi:MAG: hypothetical protein AAF456_11220 [Planctomycetota bacterium]
MYSNTAVDRVDLIVCLSWLLLLKRPIDEVFGQKNPRLYQLSYRVLSHTGGARTRDNRANMYSNPAVDRISGVVKVATNG